MSDTYKEFSGNSY